MTLFSFLLILAQASLTNSAIYCVKLATSQGATTATGLPGLFAIALNPMMLLGVFLYGGSFLLWVLMISKLPVSVLVPVSTGCFFIISILVSWRLLHEHVSLTHLLGVALIFAGVVSITLSYSKTAQP